MLTARNKLASAEDNGVVLHNPLALTHTFQPCRPAYPEAWRQFDECCSSPEPFRHCFTASVLGIGALIVNLATIIVFPIIVLTVIFTVSAFSNYSNSYE